MVDVGDDGEIADLLDVVLERLLHLSFIPVKLLSLEKG